MPRSLSVNIVTYSDLDRKCIQVIQDRMTDLQEGQQQRRKTQHRIIRETILLLTLPTTDGTVRYTGNMYRK